MDITDFSTPVRPPRPPPPTYPSVIPGTTFNVAYAIPSVISTMSLSVELGLLRFPKTLAFPTRALGLPVPTQKVRSILSSNTLCALTDTTILLRRVLSASYPRYGAHWRVSGSLLFAPKFM